MESACSGFWLKMKLRIEAELKVSLPEKREKNKITSTLKHLFFLFTGVTVLNQWAATGSFYRRGLTFWVRCAVWNLSIDIWIWSLGKEVTNDTEPTCDISKKLLLGAVAQTFVRKTGTTERGREEVLILKSSARCNFDSLSGRFTQPLNSPDGCRYEDSRMENEQGVEN